MTDLISVLLIDDEPFNRTAAARLLRTQGYGVDEAATAAEGRQKAAANPPTLILLDVELPDGNGIELCAQLKAMPALAETFIAILSNTGADSDSQAAGLEMGADAYIVRPIANRELLARVQALLRIRLAEAAVRRKASQQTILVEIGQQALAGAEIEELFAAVVALSARALQVDQCYILRLLPDNVSLALVAAAGWPEPSLGQVIHTDQGIRGKMAALQATPPPILDREQVRTRLGLGEEILRGAECLYIMIQGEQGPYALLGVHTTRARDFSSDDAQYLEALASLLSLAIMRKQAEAHVQYIAMHDGLTGLYNRNYYKEELRRLRSGRNFPVTVIILDVDGLKMINDVHGHAAGDRLLETVGKALQTSFRAEDVVARTGGDEFAALLPKMNQETAEVKIKQLRAAIAAATSVLPKGLPASASIGCATADSPDDLEQAQQVADKMMYREKTEHHRLLGIRR